MAKSTEPEQHIGHVAEPKNHFMELAYCEVKEPGLRYPKEYHFGVRCVHCGKQYHYLDDAHSYQYLLGASIGKCENT